MPYPSWSYYPRNERPPAWVTELLGILATHEAELDTERVNPERASSDDVLAVLRPDMEAAGYTVESSKRANGRIFRPVLFGEQGLASVTYEIDAFHDEHGVAVEVEAGRGVMSNADYRDIIRMSLLLDARYMVLMMPKVYRYQSSGKTAQTQGYARTRELLSAIYASQRLRLPFEGVLLIGF